MKAKLNQCSYGSLEVALLIKLHLAMTLLSNSHSHQRI